MTFKKLGKSTTGCSILNIRSIRKGKDHLGENETEYVIRKAKQILPTQSTQIMLKIRGQKENPQNPQMKMTIMIKLQMNKLPISITFSIT